MGSDLPSQAQVPYPGQQGLKSFSPTVGSQGKSAWSGAARALAAQHPGQKSGPGKKSVRAGGTLTSQRVGNRGLKALPQGARESSLFSSSNGAGSAGVLTLLSSPPTAALVQRFAQQHPPSSEAVNGPRKSGAWGGQGTLAPLKLDLTRAGSSPVKRGCGACPSLPPPSPGLLWMTAPPTGA